MKPRFIPMSIGATLGFLLLILTLLSVFDRKLSEAGAIHITSPQEGTIVVSGQTIFVSVEPSSGTSLQTVTASILPSSEAIQLQIAENPPFQVSVKVPNGQLGSSTLRAIARDQNGNILETSIRIFIEPPMPLQAMQVLPEKLFFSQTGETKYLSVIGAFSDDVARDVRSNATYVSTNTDVVTVIPGGRVDSIGLGVAIIDVRYENFLMEIPVSVGVFRTPGDFNGDDDVNHNDLKILLSAQDTASTGPGDPRDLNNDGAIDNHDAEVLMSLCARSGCDASLTLTSLSPVKLWVGLKNSDDQGTQFDLRAEMYVNDALVAEGQTLCVTGLTRNPNKAREVIIPFGSTLNEISLDSGDKLFLKTFARIGTLSDGKKCPGPGGSHSNAVGLRLYYDVASQPSQVGAEIAPEPLQEFFLHSNGSNFLDIITPTAPTAKFKDSPSVHFAKDNPWKEVGTWSMTLP